METMLGPLVAEFGNMLAGVLAGSARIFAASARIMSHGS